MKLYLLENSIFYDFGCSSMSGMLTKLTNMFVHNYKLPYHQSFCPPLTYTPSLPQSHQMAPKPKPNTRLATAQAPPNSAISDTIDLRGTNRLEKRQGKGWGLRHDLSRAPGTFFFYLFFWTILIINCI